MSRVVQMRLPIKANGHAVDPLFEEFWTIIPKHANKMLTKLKWEKITSERGMETVCLDKDANRYETIHLQATPEEIIEGARRYRKRQMDPATYKFKDDGRYLIGSATWLNQGRWMDE